MGKGGIEFLVGNGLLKQHQAGDRNAVGEACLAALEKWARARAHGAFAARPSGRGSASGCTP